MKKIHLVLLITAAVLAVSSAYSLAALNQVYRIEYEWYSQYNSKFSKDREMLRDKWYQASYPDSIRFGVISSEKEYALLKEGGYIDEWSLPYIDFNKYMLVNCSLGEVNSPEYRIKITEIAQRGNVIEIKVSLNSPTSLKEKAEMGETLYYPADIIKIDKSNIPIKGEIFFIFKNQDGRQIYEICHNIK